MKAQSSVLPVVVGILVVIIAVAVGVYVYNQYVMLSSPSASSSTGTSTGPSKISIPYSSSNKTVFLTIVVESSSNVNQFNFNGTSSGSLVIYIPAGSTVIVKFINQESLPHNLVLLQNSTPTPQSPEISSDGKIIDIVGATTSNYDVNGISGGASAEGVWGPISAGDYMLVCGILGHAASGMWAVLVASNNVTAPYAVID
ncbi:sulfocyanin [Sulfolobus acidocaldarius]|uniref:Sulfocyanin n=4 Tax=Sulfolobus acidocaldarius TaxID=2285 RepID=SOXE_SULAC|nr:sulfocyanin [Sulfolobus acidocaldarius]Q53765.1 RecName: Full=Sulfocyanin; AltName: Full=Blue copper protein [Sulfolobus acidocaldarius DSM 639]AGE72151.1 sulfocyanin, blue copper protein [Sulfolobus acidocaldarius N8]AGE74468.1 sulfocyanin, blue copper protein [Sulfolobus acidocaldarius Ron12/I]ALU29677.1 sulfocyanin [Sulfolobus acidocaldarius]ALU32412.1 sulfocyanin [Sulfolobus acidocaldarius]WCM33920.1 sulfocyanin [Sulfolobus acidocaldarius DSM 639]